MNICPYCRKPKCALNKARMGRTMTLESASTDLSPEQLQLAGKLEELYLRESSPSLQSYRDMLPPGEQALALESIPVDTSAFITTETEQETFGGLVPPSTEHWFSLESQESRFANGLVRPDAMPDEQQELLRELFLQRSAPKLERKPTAEQLKQLGWLPDNEPVAIDPSRYATGGLLIPD